MAARVGRLMLRKGNWQGKQILSEKWIAGVLADAGGPPPDRTKDRAAPRSGLCWWLNVDGVWKDVPRDAFAGAGAQNQILFVVPSLDLIVVRFGRKNLGKQFWRGLELHLFNPLLQACAGKPKAVKRGALPYPPSPVIRGVKFAPVASIVRKADGSDNWPITWADDGHQYTSYGDGWGFKPRTKEKLSQGFAKIVGGPENFRGENIRSGTGERTGDGPKGAKASGMLMVDGVLYMWVRNVKNSQLAWSTDHAKTWTWSKWKFTTSFGCPTFLNFGKNYAGARDDYVYTYSQDGPSAYVNYDGVVLARVHKSKITERKSYEFFVSPGAKGEPVWTRDIAKRGHVFVHPGRCYRMDVVYHPAIKRYLMVQAFHNLKGGWGLYDAPEPWGPWTTVHYTEDWGLGDTHGFRLPGKWLGKDGTTIGVLFSGRPHRGVNWDSFCVRKATLQLR
ncbi:MAG: hypothetical protein AMK75_04310 [Planctomycetes bacterium SM23_65]|nr:MAG: hypothetical protein AMK75_04310 [Planctomycetes bacterium SM23_65]